MQGRAAHSTREYAPCRPWNTARIVAIPEMHVLRACGAALLYTKRSGMESEVTLICCQRSRRPGQVSTICLHHDIRIAKWHKVLQAFQVIWAYPLPQSQVPASLASCDKLEASYSLRRINQHTTALARLGLERRDDSRRAICISGTGCSWDPKYTHRLPRAAKGRSPGSLIPDK